MTEGLRPMLPIPYSAAKMIAESYGYDQVVIIARRVGDDPEPRGEHVTTYGSPGPHSAAAARIGDHLKHQVMGWPAEISDDDLDRLTSLARDHFLWAPLHNPADFRAATRKFAQALGIVTLPDRRTG